MVQAGFTVVAMEMDKLSIMNVVTTDKFCHKQPEAEATIVSQAILTSRGATEILSQRPTMHITMRLPNSNLTPKFEQCK